MSIGRLTRCRLRVGAVAAVVNLALPAMGKQASVLRLHLTRMAILARHGSAIRRS